MGEWDQRQEVYQASWNYGPVRGRVDLRRQIVERLPRLEALQRYVIGILTRPGGHIMDTTGAVHPTDEILHSRGLGTLDFTKVPSGRWFRLDVIVEGQSVAALVDGKSTGFHVDRKSRFASGHIALQQYSAKSAIEFRKIEIKELNRVDQKDPKEVWLRARM